MGLKKRSERMTEFISVDVRNEIRTKHYPGLFVQSFPDSKFLCNLKLEDTVGLQEKMLEPLKWMGTKIGVELKS